METRDGEGTRDSAGGRLRVVVGTDCVRGFLRQITGAVSVAFRAQSLFGFEGGLGLDGRGAVEVWRLVCSQGRPRSGGGESASTCVLLLYRAGVGETAPMSRWRFLVVDLSTLMPWG